MAASTAASAFGIFSGLLMGNIFPSAFEVVATQSRATAVGILNLCGGLVSGFATLFGGMWKETLGIDRLLTLTGVAYLQPVYFCYVASWYCSLAMRENNQPQGASPRLVVRDL